MKKTLFRLALASALISGMVSCKKEEVNPETISETIDVSLKKNESYTFVLPESLQEKCEINTQAQHFKTSELSVNDSGQKTIVYTPALEYQGTDQLIISNQMEKPECSHQHPHPPRPPKGHKGDCKKGMKKHHKITINFTIVDNSEITTR